MPPKKKTGTKTKPTAKTSSKPKSIKAAPKPKAPRKTAVASEKIAPAKVPKAPKAVKAPAMKKVPVSKPAIPSSATKKLPKRGETQMVAFIRDPQCLFTYWEVTPESIESVKRQLMDEFQGSSMVIRVFRTGGSDGQVELIQEIFVDPNDMNRYIEIKDNTGGYILEIAQKAQSGRVVVYARSNKITLGSFSESSWASASGGAKWEMPTGLMEYFSQEEYAETFLTPGGISSAESLKRKKSRYVSSNIK